MFIPMLLAKFVKNFHWLVDKLLLCYMIKTSSFLTLSECALIIQFHQSNFDLGLSLQMGMVGFTPL